MTYTFKLARRLAVSRNYSMLPVLLVLAACGGDATAPDDESPTSGTEWRPRDLTPVAVQVNPSSVTVETNQLIHFRAHGRTSAGDSVGAAVTWSTTGGTILPDGRFSAAAIGTYTVIGLNRVRGRLQEDTSVVSVVRRHTKLAAVEVSPTSVSLTPGVSQRFTAMGRLVGGSVVPIGVNWAATGGSIDAGGTYVAGDTAGTYRVTATNTAGTLADTVSVTITAPPSPPPPPPAPPPPAVTSLILSPPSVTLAPRATRQFAAYGRTGTGDSVTVNVTFSATGGTVTSAGLFTAGTTAGSYRVVATSGALADTSTITVSVPLGGGTPMGIPFGPFNAWDGTQLQANTELFTTSLGSVNATNIADRIARARTKGVKLVLNMTGGSHDQYITNGKFDLTKWQNKMNTYNTAAIKAAVAQGVTDGVIIGNILQDEPQHPSWGGVMSKPLLDQMADYVRINFPTLPIGISMRWDWHLEEHFRRMDFMLTQYSWRFGDVTTYINGALAVGAADGVAVGFSFNILDGGEFPIDGVCDMPRTGGPGTMTSPVTGKVTRCRMTPQQVRDYGLALGPSGCALLMWRYDATFMALAENQAAFQDVAGRMASLPAKSCKRS